MFNYYLHHNIVHREKLIAKCIHLRGKVISARIKAEAFPIKAAVRKMQNVIVNAKKQFNFSLPANTPWTGDVNTICPNTGQTNLFNNYIDSNTITMTCSVILLQGYLRQVKSLFIHEGLSDESLSGYLFNLLPLHSFVASLNMGSIELEIRRGAVLSAILLNGNPILA